VLVQGEEHHDIDRGQPGSDEHRGEHERRAVRDLSQEQKPTHPEQP
jgi:hypothetical protein